MSKLLIAENFRLPIEAETETFGIIGKRGTGKTNTAVVLAEELLARDQQVVILDPLDVWYGLRSSADGKGPGFPITVLGGNHADLPLAGEAGNVLADFVVENAASVVLSLRHLSKTKQRQFVADFCTRLYHRKGEEQYRQPLQIIIDEADAFVPQRVFSGQEQMVGAIDDLVRRGRSSGIGVTLITQRAAVINKDVLTQIEVLVCHRSVSPQDRKALEAWIEAHDAHNQHVEFMKSLASLELGEAWFWSPGWLGIFKRVKVRRRNTFDSSATPKVGEKPIKPKVLAPVDLQQLEKRIAATIEKARQDDPRELRRRIAELEKAAKSSSLAKPSAKGEASAEVLQKQFEAGARSVKAELVKQLRTYDKAMSHLALRARIDIGEIAKAAERGMAAYDNAEKPEMPSLDDVIGKVIAGGPSLDRLLPPKTDSALRPSPVKQPVVRQNRATENGSLPVGVKAILTAIAQRPDGATRDQLCILTGYKRSSRDAYIQRLIGRGLITITGDRLLATEGGIEALGSDFEPLPEGEALRDHWLQMLPEGEATVLRVLVEAYPSAVERAAIDEATGYKRSSRDAYLQRLKARKLVDIAKDGTARMSEELDG